MAETLDSTPNEVIDLDMDDDYNLATRLQETYDQEVIDLSDDEPETREIADSRLAQMLQEEYDRELTRSASVVRVVSQEDDNQLTRATSPVRLNTQAQDDVQLTRVFSPVRIDSQEDDVQCISLTQRASIDDEIQYVGTITTAIVPRPPIREPSPRRPLRPTLPVSYEPPPLAEDSLGAGLNDWSNDNMEIEELGKTIDLSSNMDWRKVELKINLKAIWNTLNQLYFKNYIPFEGVEITWSDSLGNKSCRISDAGLTLHEDLRIVPRVELLAVLLRAMIIMYLMGKFNFVEDTLNFKFNFTKMRKKVNSIWLMNIKEDDLMDDTREINRRQWYNCTGVCQHHSPFYGLYHSETKPGANNQWWVKHNDSCSGSLFRIYEAVNKQTNRRAFFAHTSYMDVKFEEQDKKSIKPIAVLDLTEEAAPLPKPLSPNVTILLDDTPDNNHCDDERPFKEFFKNFDASLGSDYDAYRVPCPFCKEKIPRKLLANHFDGCYGYDTTLKISRRTALHVAGEASAARDYEYQRIRRFTVDGQGGSASTSNGIPPHNFYNKRQRFL